MATRLMNRVLIDLGEYVEQQSQSWGHSERPSELFHYTSPEGFIGIVTTKSLWASDMLSLNDASEAEYPRALIGEVFDLHRAAISDVDRERFKRQLLEYMFRLHPPFVVCFCEDGDLLSQWRAYANGGEGFALRFDFPWLASLNEGSFRLQKVVYDRAKQLEMVGSLLALVTSALSKYRFSAKEQTHIWQSAAGFLEAWVVMFKAPAFAEEKEWRLGSVFGTSYPRRFRRSGHRIVEYVEIPITDTGCLNGVIRGPYFTGTDWRGAYRMMVSHNFISGANFRDSRIPLRR
jgi:hypothetical protein